VRVYTKYRSEERRAKRRSGKATLVFVCIALLAGLAWLGRKQHWWQRIHQFSFLFSQTNHAALTRPVTTNAVASAPSIGSSKPMQANITASNSASPSPEPTAVLEAQIALDRLGISPGSIDGVLGAQTRCALRAFQAREDLPATGELDGGTRGKLLLNAALTTYRVEQADLSRLAPLALTWLGKSEQERLDYETLLELVAERCHSHPRLIQKLNSGLDWRAAQPGIEVVVPRVEREAPPAKASLIQIVLSTRSLQAFDSTHRLVAHFPCSIAQRVEKRPVGELHVAVLAPNPNYTFQPEVFLDSPEAREIDHKLILKPGPNNPVGTVWIGLDRPGYGIHGTPKPEDVGRTESHGCFRLANWNAEYLLQLVTIGTTVRVAP
jgi:lipoprotein-anchoring transpeptidase ErfK/SrfK